MFWERMPKKFVKKMKIWHLLQGITLWTIWIERKDRVFNQEQWHECKVKHLIPNDLRMYANVAWDNVVKYVKVNASLVEALFKGFDETWGAKNVLCRHEQI
jgi:hypothetical protein